jgi:putative peptidoglycan lipid II flippase
LSRALKAGDFNEAAKLQDKSLEFGLLLTVPAAIAFLIMPDIFVALVYERGAFTRETTLMAGAVLFHFGWGLPAATLISTFRPGYYAREDMKTPMWFAAINAATNIVLSLTLFPVIGLPGIAVATSTAQWLNAILLGATLWRRGLFSPSAVTVRNLLLILITNAVLALLLLLAVKLYGPLMLDGRILGRIAATLGTVTAAAIVYFAIVFGTGAMDRKLFVRLLRRKSKTAGDGDVIAE